MEYNSWIKVFEDTLILTSWVNFTKHPKVVFYGGRDSLAATQLRKFMINYNSIAKRKEGMGNKYLKFHQISHLWWVIRLFSSLPNIDSGRNESHHKKKKQIGSHTQKRLELFDIQTAEKEYVHDLFIKAMKKASLLVSLSLKFISMILSLQGLHLSGNVLLSTFCNSGFVGPLRSMI